MQVARIKFSQDLVPQGNAATINIVERNNQHTMLIAIPIKAIKPTVPGDKTVERDAYVWPNNLVSINHLKIQIKKVGDNEPFSKLSIEADLETKVPETGDQVPQP